MKDASGALDATGQLAAPRLLRKKHQQQARCMKGAKTGTRATASGSKTAASDHMHGHHNLHLLSELATQQPKTRAPRAALAQSARMKRPLEAIDSNQDPLRSKKARITVEILASRPRVPSAGSPQKQAIALLSSSPRPALHQQTLHHHFRPILPQQTPSTIAAAAPPIVPRPAEPTPALTTTTKTAPATVVSKQQQQQQQQLRQAAALLLAQPQSPTARSLELFKTTSTTASHEQPPITKHQKKVVNGIKHELDRLQPSAADASAVSSTGRKLRSQEATRFKSELSAYFPDYDEVIGNEPKEQHQLNPDTPIITIDSRPKEGSSRQAQHEAPIEDYPIRSYGDSLFINLVDAHRVDLTSLGSPAEDEEELVDSLPDSMYEPSHRKAERLEKSIRNTERSRAQHERDQIVRILGELQGHDWLRTMGVNGVTETRKKTFEPARDHFIRGCQTILGKFRHWSQEEKRRKLEKERAVAEEEEELEESDENDASGRPKKSRNRVLHGSDDEADRDVDSDAEDSQHGDDVDMSDALDDGDESDGDPPDSSDVDASIARQLRDEAALAHAKYHKTHPSKRPPRGAGSHPVEHVSPVRHREFTSFFDKKSQRDAALNRTRRRGRHVASIAWGHNVPDFDVYDFDLPEEFLDTDTMKTRERQKRRARREAKH